MGHELAGKLVRKDALIDVEKIRKFYYDKQPNLADKSTWVSFGTSGHRGKSEDGTFTDVHVAAITQAICDGRKEFGATGICFVGQDTHALSQVAFQTVVEVLAGNEINFAFDQEGDFVPTPSISRAILRSNKDKTKPLNDGIVITPSHNPPEHGGIKYNPPHGGPAEESITKWIENCANEYLQQKGKGIKRKPFTTLEELGGSPYEYKRLYVKELVNIIDIDSIKKGNLRVLVDALGGSGAAYWRAISKVYGLEIDIINDVYDPTFSFMHYDVDGEIRMDCSSPAAMTSVIEQIGNYDLAVGNDPDYDRYGVVTQKGLMLANQFLCIACDYLFDTRHWAGKGIAKTIVVTELLNRIAKKRDIDVYEVPVGFKYFSDLLFRERVGLVGEESAGGSFLQKDGTVWTTDKDGIVMALLAMEIMAKTGKGLFEYYQNLASPYGEPVTGRFEAKCSKQEKEILKQLTSENLKATTIAGDDIQEVRTTSLYGETSLGGVRITTTNGWLVARPSGTEDLYKVYGESFLGREQLQLFLNAGKELVAGALVQEKHK